MGGGLVFTGMPRRKEVLGTGIIRWTKVVNPDGTVTWQEAQAAVSSNSKKDEKDTKIEKPSLDRPSWIESKKESNVRVSKRRATDAEDLGHKDKRIETRLARAFSFQTDENKTDRAEKTTTVEEVSLNASTQDDKKRVSVSGLAMKFGGTAEASRTERKEVEAPKKESVETQPAHLPLVNPPSPPKEEIDTFDNSFSSHWSRQQDPNPTQESDAELAERLANTEKIFRQQERKIQAALDRIKDLERQLASGFSTNTSDQDETQSKMSWDNSSITAGGRESGPHFRHIPSSANAKGPLPFSRDDDPHYRVLTVNSNKPEVVCTGDYHDEHEVGTCEVDGTRTPSPIAVDVKIPPATLHQHQNTIAKSNTTIEIPKTRISAIKPTPTPSLKSYYPPSPARNTTSNHRNIPATGATKHKPLPVLPVDARATGTKSSTGPKLSPPLYTPYAPSLGFKPTTHGAKPSLCIGSGRPRPPRSVSSFEKMHKIRPLTPIPEEPCSLNRRPRVPRRRSRSSLRRVSMGGECTLVRSGSGRSQRGVGGEGGGRRSLERCRTN